MTAMKLTDLTNSATNPLPEEARDLVGALLEGRVRSMFLVAEVENQDGATEWIEGYGVCMEDHESDIRAFVGAITLNLDELKRDVIDGEFVTDGDDDE